RRRRVSLPGRRGHRGRELAGRGVRRDPGQGRGAAARARARDGGHVVSARILLIDNYDSFTFNLVQGLRTLGAAVRVVRNDEITPEEALLLLESSAPPTHLVLSPGPGTPARAGRMPALLERFQERVPILGVCLGHQAIGARFGGRIARATRPLHGKVSRIYHDGRGVLRGLPKPFEAGRYHSLCVSEDGL